MEENLILRSVRTASLATLWLVPLLILVSAFSSGWISTWHTVGVPAMTPSFLDLYSIPTAVETLHEGGDPLVTNARDPYHRAMNYPRVWMYLFSAAGITTRNISIVAIIFCTFYLGCMSFLISQTKHAADAAILLLASLSISPMFAMERGNNGMFIFSLLFLAYFVTSKYLKSGLFGAAALLKFYLIVAMIVAGVHRPIKERKLVGLAILLVATLILLQWHDLAVIRHGTPVSRTWSYGAPSLEGELLRDTRQWGFLASLGWTVVLECWLVGALAIRNAWENAFEPDASLSNSKFVELFSVFGGIYDFTYAIGSNWNYRLIFLLPTIPITMEMARGHRHRLWAITYLVMLGIAENSIAFESPGAILAGHIATFTLFILLLVMLTNQTKLSRMKRAAAAPVEA
jgi:hypothetical protein